MKTRIAKCLLCAGTMVFACLLATSLQATTIIDDSWADGDLAATGFGGEQDTDWWTSSSSSGLEVGVGFMGLVTGSSSGRGGHTIFPVDCVLDQIGESVKATFTFTTPDTIGRAGNSSIRFGLFDDLGRAGLNGNVSASSGSPNDLYGWSMAQGNPDPDVPGIPGYMMDFDNGGAASADINFREHDVTDATGRLMATTTSFDNISPSGPDEGYVWDPNTTYTASFQVKRVSATEMELTGTLGAATYSITDVFDSDTINMFAFHVNSDVFGSSNVQGDPDNGIDFTNIKIEHFEIPEPSALALLLVGLVSLAGLIRRR